MWFAAAEVVYGYVHGLNPFNRLIKSDFLLGSPSRIMIEASAKRNKEAITILVLLGN